MKTLTSGLMCGLHDVIVASEGMGKDLGSLIGDSSLTGNALNGFLTIVKRFLLVITLEISTKVTDENQKETGSMNEGNREIRDLENKSSNYGDYIPLLNLVKAAICSIRLGKYSISTEDTIAENNRENMKRKTSILINSVNESEESHRSLGVYPSKRKQYAGFINQR